MTSDPNDHTLTREAIDPMAENVAKGSRGGTMSITIDGTMITLADIATLCASTDGMLAAIDRSISGKKKRAFDWAITGLSFIESGGQVKAQISFHGLDVVPKSKR